VKRESNEGGLIPRAVFARSSGGSMVIFRFATHFWLICVLLLLLLCKAYCIVFIYSALTVHILLNALT